MATKPRRYVKGQIKIDTLLAFVFGLIFVVAILYFAVTIVNPSPFQMQTFKTVLALAAGGVGAVIPGQFELKHLPFVRAGGALAVFAAVFFAPVSVVSPVTQLKEPTEDSAPVVEKWFAAVDAGNYRAAWSQADPATAQWWNLDFEKFQQVFQNVRTPLGKNVSRRVTSLGDNTNPANLPPGLYRYIAYISKYEQSPQCIPEAITLRATEDLHWKVFSHQIWYNQMPCMDQAPAAEGAASGAAPEPGPAQEAPAGPVTSTPTEQ